MEGFNFALIHENKITDKKTNTLETTSKELLGLGYTSEEIRNVIEEITERIDQYANNKIGE